LSDFLFSLNYLKTTTKDKAVEFSFLTETIRSAQIVANQSRISQYVYCTVKGNDAQANFTTQLNLKGREVLEVCHPVKGGLS